MFNVSQVIKEITNKLSRGEALSSFEQVMANAKAIQQRNRRKAEQKFKATHEIIHVLETNGVQVPVWRYTGWSYGSKYTGEKLRKIRAEQAQELKQTHPELAESCVELWKYPKGFKTTKVSRQQRRAAERKAKKGAI
jgi:hypothetical protein